MAYHVSGAAAVVSVGGTEVYLYRGATVPDGATNLEHLLSVGLVEAGPDLEVIEEAAVPEWHDGLTNDQIKQIAKDEGIDLVGATAKADLILAVETGRAAKAAELADGSGSDV